MLDAGVARRIINPPQGVPLSGYPRLQSSRGVLDDLTATSLVLREGSTEVALVGLDLLYVNESMVDEIRGRVSPIEVVLCCSHTHSGPITYAGEKAPRLTRRYLESLVEDVVSAVREASETAVPATATYSFGAGDISINRRQRMPDGSIKTGQNHDGPVDRSLQVVSIMNGDGARMLTVVNYACHPTVLGPYNARASADWVGVMRARVERELGGRAMFLQGASGDINPEWSFPFPVWAHARSHRMVKILGNRVAESVLDAVRNNSEELRVAPLGISREEVWLPSEVLESAHTPTVDYREAFLRELGLPRFCSFGVDYFIDKIFPWKFPRVEAKDGVWAVPMRVSSVRIGDLAIATLAAEPFTELGLKIKESSPAKRTLVVGAADGTVLYIPTAEEHALGGFETLSWALLKMPGNYARNVGDITCDRVLGIIKRLWER